MRTVTIVLLATLVACGKKAPPAAPAPSGPEITASMPDTPEARKFASKLLDTAITGYPMVGGSGGGLVFDRMTFAPDGTWKADATLTAGDESMPCTEIGTWRIDSATAATHATMDWEITKTTCASREPGTVTRVEMGILEGGEIKLLFR